MIGDCCILKKAVLLFYDSWLLYYDSRLLYYNRPLHNDVGRCIMIGGGCFMICQCIIMVDRC